MTKEERMAKAKKYDREMTRILCKLIDIQKGMVNDGLMKEEVEDDNYMLYVQGTNRLDTLTINMWKMSRGEM